jgi:hypothetical protein
MQCGHYHMNKSEKCGKHVYFFPFAMSVDFVQQNVEILFAME